jgi:SAM-dependent methyltransferase
VSELSIAVDPANIEQVTAWDGDEGAYWADNAERFDRFMTAYHAPFLAAAAIRATDRVLDIGCGTGQTTRDAARAAAAGSALGVDLSARMIGYARQAAHRDRIGNATFEQGDAQIYPFPAGVFDVAISRTGAMFFGFYEPTLLNSGFPETSRRPRSTSGACRNRLIHRVLSREVRSTLTEATEMVPLGRQPTR